MPKVGMEPIRREQIRRAAVKIIAARGFDRTTLAGVAKAADISTGTINHYYENKVEMLVDALLSVSTWFQDSIAARIAAEETAEAKLRALVRFGIDDADRRASDGHRVWTWALAEAIQSEQLLRVINERRRLFEGIILGILSEFDPHPMIGTARLEYLAAEIDAYLNGFAIHHVTRAANLDVESMESSLVAMVRTRLGMSGATKDQADASIRLPGRRGPSSAAGKAGQTGVGTGLARRREG
jgi:TetR/AcrR family transcriptional repressor of bet genes